ncbi:MAG: S-methyl-5-thioribose-1-phosphate isomerase [Actinomycetia bacterium]|nr:S-methyl-5-thioribose-1-phosphate isomerase [Actinomycetes bacterium]
MAAVWWDGGLRLVDQTRLPEAYQVLAPTTLEAVAEAIERLRVRGAPAIGIAAAFGLVTALDEVGGTDGPAAEARLEAAAARLRRTRPTAVNLFWALDRVLAEVAARPAGETVRAAALAGAGRLWAEERERCRRIGEAGAPLLAGSRGVLTHCNAGALGTSGYGTATAPLYRLREQGRPVPVFVDETRPLLQGARLTAWELDRAGIPVTVVVDGAAATVMRRGLVDAVIVGADRITARGDVANKIGTYGLAVLARAHGIPFYVAAPRSTFDLARETGEEIVVEERPREDVASCGGRRTVPEGVAVRNWAFDVTPAEYVTAFITDGGVIRPPFPEALRAWAG